MKLTYKNREIEFEPFPCEENMLVKINIRNGDGSNEGCWAWLNPIDMPDYKADVTDPDDKVRVAIMANAAFGVPWGSFFPYRMQGQTRPVCVAGDVSGEVVMAPAELLPADC